jgi:hypothetical protein
MHSATCTAVGASDGVAVFDAPRPSRRPGDRHFESLGREELGTTALNLKPRAPKAKAEFLVNPSTAYFEAV